MQARRELRRHLRHGAVSDGRFHAHCNAIGYHNCYVGITYFLRPLRTSNENRPESTRLASQQFGDITSD